MTIYNHQSGSELTKEKEIKVLWHTRKLLLSFSFRSKFKVYDFLVKHSSAGRRLILIIATFTSQNMGKAKKVHHFDVTIKATIDGKKGSRNFSSMATVLPERGGSYPTILGLVRASRKSGSGGRVLGVHNKGQVNGSAAFFDDTSVDYVNNIVKDLPNHGACAAFVKVQPTVVVPIPVFVLDDAQFKQVIELQGNNTEVNLIPSHTSRFESSRENDNTIDLIETEDQIGFNHKEVS